MVRWLPKRENMPLHFIVPTGTYRLCVMNLLSLTCFEWLRLT